MRCGFAERDITPEKGLEHPGTYGKKFHGPAAHDPCKVRAALFDDGQRIVSIVGVDATFLPASLAQAARTEIHEACGLPPEAVLIAASHTHSGGPTGMILPGQFDHAPDLVKRLAYECSSCADAAYLYRVKREIVAAVAKAHRTRTESRCGVGAGEEGRAVFNRRFRMRDGLTYTHPGQGNPDVIEPAGPIDPAVGVIGSWDGQGNLLGCVVNYACHGTTWGGEASADWIFQMERAIRGYMGEQAVVVFVNGAAGDVTQVDNLNPFAHPTGERWARLVGGRVGAEALKTLVSMETGDLTPVESRRTFLPIARRRPGADRLRKAREIIERGAPPEGDEWVFAKDAQDKDAPTEWVFAKEILLLEALEAAEPTVEVELQAIQIGPAVFLANPSELFCEYGLELKAASQFPFTFPVELANGCVGYAPTEEAFGPNGGGYETRLTSYSNLAPQAGRMIVEGLLGLTASLTPGVAPLTPPAPPFRGAWAYGATPPELE